MKSTKDSSLLEVEMYFHECKNLNSYFKYKNNVGGGNVLEFKGTKSSFWNELFDLDSNDFQNFKSLFSKIEELFNS